MSHPKTENRLRTTPPNGVTFKRRRCENCNKLYLPSRIDQRFCRELPDKDKCRKEFFRYGSSYGPLKTGLHKAIDKKYDELRLKFTKMFIEMGKSEAHRINALLVDVVDIRSDIQKLAVEVGSLRAELDTARGRIENLRMQVKEDSFPSRSKNWLSRVGSLRAELDTARGQLAVEVGSLRTELDTARGRIEKIEREQVRFSS